MKNKTLQYKFMAAMLFVAVLPFFITPIIGYIYTSMALRDKLVSLANQNLEAVAEEIDQVLNDVIVASNVVAIDSDITNILESPSQTQNGHFFEKKEVEKKLQNMESGNLYPYNVKTMLVDLKGNTYETQAASPTQVNYTKESWFQEAVNKKGYFIWSGGNAADPGERDGISMVRLVKENFYLPIGVLFIYIYPEMGIKNLLHRERDFTGTERYLVDSQNQVIMSTGKVKEIPQEVLKEMHSLGKKEYIITKQNDEKVVVSLQAINKPQWSLVQVTPYESIMSEVSGYRNFMIMTNVLFLIIMMIVAYFVAKLVTTAIRQLCFFIGKVTDGNFDVKSDISGCYEVNQLSGSFNKMVDRINDLVTQVAVETERRQQTKLEALQAQINPHFLLNTLNGIKWLCVIENAKTAEKMLISLGYLLENTLGRYEELIPIEEEYKCLDSYCQLQKMRYGKRFEVHYEILDDLGQIRVPVLLLQPVVENSILHAFENQETTGDIWISVREQAGYVEITVRDNGIGISQMQIDQLCSQYPQKNKYSSMGIRNVRDRIKLYYGEECGLVMSSEIGSGTQTVLTIRREVRKVVSGNLL